MFRKIIVAVDGQDGGLDASALARTLAAPTAELVAARVLPRDDGPHGVADAGDDDAVTAARRVVEATDRQPDEDREAGECAEECGFGEGHVNVEGG